MQEEFTFNSFQEFYLFTTNEHSELRVSVPQIAAFCMFVEKINVGCGCQKNVRVERAEKAYLALAATLTIETKTQIKELKNAKKIVFVHNEARFLEIVE